MPVAGAKSAPTSGPTPIMVAAMAIAMQPTNAIMVALNGALRVTSNNTGATANKDGPDACVKTMAVTLLARMTAAQPGIDGEHQ